MAYSKQNFQDGQILTAANLEKMENGIIAGQGARNLLDNSDFRNPVNQRGIANSATIERYTYFLDRWSTGDTAGTITLNSNGLIFNVLISQRIDPAILRTGTTITAAAKFSDGTLVIVSGVVNLSTSWHWLPSPAVDGCQIGLVDGTSNGIPYVRIGNENGKTLAWAALYEGSYTADTLPAYQPKGYAAELAECQRYFERLGGTSSQTLGNAVFAKAGAKSVIISIKYSPKRLSNPTLSFSIPSDYRMLQKDAVNASTVSACSITSFDNIATETPFAYFRVNLANALQSDLWLVLQRADGAKGAYIDVNADL